MKSAKMARRQRRMTTKPPTTASLLRMSRRQASRQRLELSIHVPAHGSAPTGGGPAGEGRLVSDAGVDKAIGQVYQEIHEGEKGAIDEHHRHDHRIIAAGHRQDEESAHP